MQFFFPEQPKTWFSGRRPWFLFRFSSDTELNLVHWSKILVLKDIVFFISPRPHAAEENFLPIMESSGQRLFHLQRKTFLQLAEKPKAKTACSRSFVHFLCDRCFKHSNISFSVSLTFWIYSDAITDFQVLDQYFLFSKKILSVFSSSSAVSGLGPIEKLYLLKKGLRPLCQALVRYY